MSEPMVDATVTTKKEFTDNADLIDDDDIIDVSVFDFDDPDTWLYVPQCTMETKVQDLQAWLRSEPVLPNSQKAIDTRTFTRPKKRSIRTSFVAHDLDLLSIAHNVPTSSVPLITEARQGTSSMLKTISNTTGDVSGETGTSGHESMDLFLNMSLSKGIDSFINLTDPGFSDPIMNESQPSVFFSSITSLPREELLNITDSYAETIDNLTHSVNCDSKPNELNNLNNINATFSRADRRDSDIQANASSDINETFTNRTQVLDEMKVNETYDAQTMSTTLVLSSTDLSSTYVGKGDTISKEAIGNEMGTKDIIKLDTTYSSSKPGITNPVGMNETYLPVNVEHQNIDAERPQNPNQIIGNNRKLNTVYCSSPSVNSLFHSTNDQELDLTFKLPLSSYNQSTPKNIDAMNSTFKIMAKQSDKSQLGNTMVCQSVKAPSLLRRELLAEIQRSEENKMECKYMDAADEMRIQAITTNNNAVLSLQKNEEDRKFYTFTKKSAVRSENIGSTDLEPVEKADTTFTKPLSKLQKKKPNEPRLLSKLPQFLQKSNPNLVSSSLKTLGQTARTNASNLTFMKGSQPNIQDVDKSATSKLFALRKVRSGSEQRLLELAANPTDFQLVATGGSTESIESTQSAHSAPDLDDRLSVCSDSSHNSYTVQPMNIEQLHQIVKMQEESLKEESTPKLGRQILKNNWTDVNKSEPSPILKNGADDVASNSPLSMDHTVKTSSPLFNLTGSSPPSNSNEHPMDNAAKQQKIITAQKAEVVNKQAPRPDTRTRLRAPTNFNTSNRPPGPVSAIPRPPSRIPAFRFSKPPLKSSQLEDKKG